VELLLTGGVGRDNCAPTGRTLFVSWLVTVGQTATAGTGYGVAGVGGWGGGGGGARAPPPPPAMGREGWFLWPCCVGGLGQPAYTVG
jgi:hypothetical protein